MTFRTPRRRSSPRTRRKYIVLRNFFKRTGNHSESEIKINTSVDVSELKHKNTGAGIVNDQTVCSDTEVEPLADVDVVEVAAPAGNGYLVSSKEPRLLYKTRSHSQYQVDQGEPPDDRDRKTCHAEVRQERLRGRAGLNVKSEHSKLRKHKSRHEAGDTTMFRSLAALVPEYGEEGRGERTARRLQQAHCELATYRPVADRYKTREPLVCHEDVLHYGSARKPKPEFDEDFIAKIIKKQYQPVKIFDKLNSDVSQYSVPVCRDRSHKLRRIKEDTELYCKDCGLDRDTCDTNSVCETRHAGRHRHRSRPRPPPSARYYDSTLYDVIPVKEESSPKSRRKFEENIDSNNVYRDIPPSPKSQRPRLNLESRYVPDSDDGHSVSRRDQAACHHADNTEEEQGTVDDVKCVRTRSKRKQKLSSKCLIDPEDLYLPDLQSCQPALDVSVNVPPVEPDGNVCDEQPSVNTVTADKALGEIKEILQNFLQEMKKDNVSSNSENKSETNTSKPGNNEEAHVSTNGTSPPPDGIQHTRVEFPSSTGKYDMPSALPQYNPCCYPVLPFYPMNCMQNAYVLPSGSVTCPMCAHTSHSADSQLNNAQNKSSSKSNSLTQELIKEIYRCVAQKPANVGSPNQGFDNNTSRSSGTKGGAWKHDAQVGTTRLNYHSKSCEALGSQIIPEIYIPKVQATRSDSVLEKHSVNQSVSRTSSYSEISSEGSVSSVGKKKNKFKKILKSLGLMKKKKATKPPVESEERQYYEQKQRHPFRQDMMSYMMHEQEMYMRHPSPHPAPHLGRPPAPVSEFYTSEQCYHPAMFQQHAPLCLKEIEVKSTATQSDYWVNEPKKSFFGSLLSKFQNVKIENTIHDNYLTTSTQTKSPKKEPEKMAPFFWKNNWNVDRNADPLNNKQKLLPTGNMNLKNDLFKKLFSKRNPFSPSSMVVRSLMGKDKTNYGMSTGVLKPKMFF